MIPNIKRGMRVMVVRGGHYGQRGTVRALGGSNPVFADAVCVDLDDDPGNPVAFVNGGFYTECDLIREPSPDSEEESNTSASDAN